MDNRLIIAALGAGIGAAATYISTKVQKTERTQSPILKKRKNSGDNDNDVVMNDDIGGGFPQPIDTTNAISVSNTSTLSSPFSKDKVDTDSMLQNEIFDEQMNRTMLYYGEEAFAKIRDSFVVVVGLGGVGGACAHALLRSGVKKLRIIDPDLVTLSSLNRNVLAQRKDVGRSKVEMMKSYFAAICPEVEVEAIQAFFVGDMAPQLLQGADYVLDCIDHTESKVQLLTYCVKNNIKVMSSFGAGSSSDPTKINICDLSMTFGCPFGKEVRKLLRNNGIVSGIACICSTESHRKKLIPLTEQEKELLKTAPASTLRIRTLGVSMPIPFIFGTTMANACLNDIVGLPLVAEEERRAPPPLIIYNKMQKTLVKSEQNRFSTPPTTTKQTIEVTNIRYLVDQVFEGCSAFNPGDNTALLTIRRWRPELPLSINNIIPMTNNECSKHEKFDKVEDNYPPEVITRIDNILKEIKDIKEIQQAAPAVGNQQKIMDNKKKQNQPTQPTGKQRNNARKKGVVDNNNNDNNQNNNE